MAQRDASLRSDKTQNFSIRDSLHPCKPTMNRILRILVMFITLTTIGTGNLYGFQEKIDWLWNDTRPTARQGPTCLKYIVKAYPIRILRGRVSGRACIEKAVVSYQKGDHEEAFGWILGGYCHDRLVRVDLVKHAPKVMEYVVEQYGNKVSQPFSQ